MPVEEFLPPSGRALRRLLQLYVWRLLGADDPARRGAGLLLLPGRPRGQEQDQAPLGERGEAQQHGHGRGGHEVLQELPRYGGDGEATGWSN